MNPVSNQGMMDRVADGQLNRCLGWGLLLFGLAAAVVLDPWSFSVHSAAEWVASARPFVRLAQGIVLEMAFLQLGIGYVLAADAFPRAVRCRGGLLIAAGAIFYITGYALAFEWPIAAWLAPMGSLLSVIGLLSLLFAGPTGPFAADLKLGLPVVCFGMLLDLIAGLSTLAPEYFLPDYLGGQSGVRLRMLRLARVAAVALSVLTLLYLGLARRLSGSSRLTEWGRRAMLCGAIGMPTILAASCYFWLPLKYGLAIPATATFTGVFIGVGLTWSNTALLEKTGWLLVASSLTVGMLMGFYAFDGPLPTPEFLGSYNEFPRRLSRLGHAYCIVLGMLAIFLSREIQAGETGSRVEQGGVSLLIAGILITLIVVSLQAIPWIPFITLGIGPAIVVTATLFCLIAIRRRA